MNDNATRLLERLAQKLGTTSEYLWGVILKQAPIAAFNGIIFIMMTIALGIILWKIHKKLAMVQKRENGRMEGGYEHHGAVAGGSMVLSCIVFLILLVVSFFLISRITTAIFNPEFWAFAKVVETIGG